MEHLLESRRSTGLPFWKWSTNFNQLIQRMEISFKNEGSFSISILEPMILWFSDSIFAKSAIVKMGAMLEAWKNVHDKRTYTLGNTTLQTEHCTTLHTAEYRKLRVTLSLKVVTATASKLGATTGKIGVWHRWNFQKPDYFLCTLNNKVLSILWFWSKVNCLVNRLTKMWL